MARLSCLRERLGALGAVVAATVAVAVGVPMAHGALSTGVTNTTDTAASNAYYTCGDAGAGDSTTNRSFFTLPLSESARTTAADVSGNNNGGTYSTAGVTYGVDNGGVCSRDNRKVVTLDGAKGALYDNTKVADTNGPQSFSVEIWFKAATDGKGVGKLIGYGSTASTTATSSNYDRHLYIGADGKLLFGIYNGATQTITTATSVIDGKWHYAVGSFSAAAGLTLYLDGAKIGGLTLATNNFAQKFAGYWRIGYDSLSSWPDAPAAANYFFGGSLAFASVYNYVLGADQVQSHYLAGKPSS